MIRIIVQDTAQRVGPAGPIVRCDEDAAAGLAVLAQDGEIAAYARGAQPERLEQRQAAALGEGGKDCHPGVRVPLEDGRIGLLSSTRPAPDNLEASLAGAGTYLLLVPR